MDYKELVKQLPAPQTKEEQYVYALVCSVAEVENQGKLSDNPFYRLEQYWRAFYKVMQARLGAFLDTVPKEGQVSSSAIQDYSVSTDKLSSIVEARLLGNKRVTEAMLVDALADRLLASGKITEDMLAKAVVDKLLTSGSVTEDKLASAVVAKLLANDRVATDMLKNNSVTYEKLSTDLQAKIDKIK